MSMRVRILQPDRVDVRLMTPAAVAGWGNHVPGSKYSSGVRHADDLSPTSSVLLRFARPS